MWTFSVVNLETWGLCLLDFPYNYDTMYITKICIYRVMNDKKGG
jgi:hypothetical protein